MKYPKVRFITNNPEKEAEYICFLAKSISDNLYQNAGLLVLPEAIPSTVYFLESVINLSSGN